MRFSFLILILSNSLLFAQSPDGKLYFFTGPGGFPPPYLGYVQYPYETYHVVDSIQLSDIAMIDDKLFAAAYLDVIAFDTASNQATDTIPNVYARNIEAWDDKLAMISVANPYFRVYDVQAHSLIFSIDTQKLQETPTDIKVWDNKAFLLMTNSVVIVDLVLEDTIATVATPHPYTNQDYNYFLIDAGGDFYIDVEYTTGAIRFSLLRMNKITNQVQTVFHNEGYANFSEPVVADDEIYLSTFDTRYDISDDSLYISSNQWWPLTIEYDDASEALFLYHNPPNGINYVLNGSFSDTVMIQGYLTKALFVPHSNDTLNAIPGNKNVLLNIYPNPVSGWIHVELDEIRQITGVQLLDLSGKMIDNRREECLANGYWLDCSDLPHGLYFLKIFTQEKILSTRFTK